MSYWDPSLPNAGSGGATQQLQLNGYTLSLVPDGNSVLLPSGGGSNGPNLIVSSVQARDQIVVGPTSNIRLFSTGDAYVRNIYGTLGNFITGNTTNLTTVNLAATTANLQTVNNRTLNTSTIVSDKINTSSITIGDIRYMTIAQDTATPATTVTQTANQVFFKTNVGVQSPFVLAAATANLTDVNATTVEAATYLSSGTVYAGQVGLNGHQLSNNATNLLYDGQPIYTGQRGDASQWAQFPAANTVNMNNQAINNVGLLNVNYTANLNTQHAGTISMLTNGANSDSGGAVNIGFDTGALSATQPDLNANCRDVQITAGAAVSPSYALGRLIQMDAYPGISYYGTPQTRQSAVRITAHGTTGPYIPLINAAAAGVIELNAYNPTLTTDLFPPKGTIRLNGSYVTVGNDNSLPLIGATLQANVQALDVQVIAGSELLPGFGNPIPATLFRSGNGVEIQTNPLELTYNTDSKLYVKEVIGQSNTRQLFPDPFGPYLLLDGLAGGTTINNFKTANGQGSGATLNNIATMSGSYPTSVQLQIDALAAAIANIPTTPGTSNLAAWSGFPAISTVVTNKNIYMTGVSPSISTNGSLNITDLVGNYGEITVKKIGLSPAGNVSSFVTTDVSNNFLFQNIINGVPQPATLATSGVYMNNNLVTANASNLFVNGTPITGGGGTTTPNPLFSTVTLGSSTVGDGNLIFIRDPAGSFNQLVNQYYSGQAGYNLTLTALDQVGAAIDIGVGGIKVGQAGGSSAYGRIYSNNDGIGIEGHSSGGSLTNTYFLADSTGFSLNNLSSINGVAYAPGGGGTSNINQWSYYPVLSNSIQFGSQSIWLKGTTNALFTTSNGIDTIPVTAQKFVTFDANNVGVISEFQLDTDGVPMVSKNDIPSWLRVSTLYLSSTTLSSDGSNLFINGSNVTSSNVAGWAAYPASANVQLLSGKNLIVSTTTAQSVVTPSQIFMSNTAGTNNLAMTATGNNQTIINNNASGLTMTMNGTNRIYDFEGGKVFVNNDLQCAFSTITPRLILNSNNLTASNGNLYFNGSIVNASNTVDTWATFPAVSNIDMSSNKIFGISTLTSVNYTGSNGFSIYPGTHRFNGITSVWAPNTFDFTSQSFIVNGVATTGLNGIYASPSGFAYQNPNAATWYKTTVNSGVLTINQMSNNTTTQSGLVYDTVFNPLPTTPPTYLVPKGTIQSTAYSAAGVFQVANGIASFALPANQNLLTFKIRPATSMTGNGFAGIGPIGNYDYQSTIMASVGGYNNSTNAFATYSMYVNATAGTFYNFILNFPATGVVGITEVSLKPLSS